MELVLSLKEMSRRRLRVAVGVIVSLALAVLLVFQVSSIFPPVLKSRQKTVWIAGSQVLVDAHSSAIGNLNQGLDPLIPRAGVYANLMTSPALVAAVGSASGIPASYISVSGPIGTNGQRPKHGASTTSLDAPVYSLLLDTDETQPIIRITAQAPTSRGAAALATGAAVGLTNYVTALETTQQVSIRHRVDVRQLGTPVPSATTSGITPVLFLPIFLIFLAVWCMLVLFASRFAEAWRQGPAPEPAHTDWSGLPAYDDELSAYPTLEQDPDEALYTDPDEFEFDWEADPEPDPDRALVNGQSSDDDLETTGHTNGHPTELPGRRPAWLQRRSRARPKT